MNAGVSQTQRLPLPLPGRLPLGAPRPVPLNPDLRGLLALPGDLPLPRAGGLPWGLELRF